VQNFLTQHDHVLWPAGKVADSILGRATSREPEMFTDSWSAMLSTHPGDALDQAVADATVIGRSSPSTDDAAREGQTQTLMVPMVSILWVLHLVFRQNTWLPFSVTIMDCAALISGRFTSC
jgi:hypothetical protein